MNRPVSLKDFPVLETPLDGKRLVYLDSAATSLKPEVVVDSMDAYYRKYSANVHRGVYQIAEKASWEYEKSRELVAKFIGAKPEEVIFVRNTTEAINVVALGWGENNIKRGDNIICSLMEHHSNLIPWQKLALKKKAKVEYLDITQDGQLKLNQLKKMLFKKTKIVALTHVSNTLGTINDVKKIVKMAHEAGAAVLIDGAQATAHLPVSLSDLGSDFYAFSGHKMLGPTGIGVLWIKKELIEQVQPVFFGGGMIEKVSLKRVTFLEPPFCFEAGTPNIAGAIGLGAAVSYLNRIGMNKIRDYEQQLSQYALGLLGRTEGITIYGPDEANARSGIMAFTISNIHPHDLASILDKENIAVRAGHHCCMPLHRRLGIEATARISFSLYNTIEDIDLLIAGIKKAIKVFR